MMSPDDAACPIIVATPIEEPAWSTRILTLPNARAEQMQFVVANVRSITRQIEDAARSCQDVLGRSEGSDRLESICGELRDGMGDFRFADYDRLVDLLETIAAAIPDASEEILHELVVRARAIHLLLDQFVAALEVGNLTRWPLDTFAQRIGAIAGGQVPPVETSLWHGRSPERVLELDGVVDGGDGAPQWLIQPPRDEASVEAAAAALQASDRTARTTAADRQVRVGVELLDRLGDIAGQLVLCKNRLFGVSRDAARRVDDRELVESLAGISHEFEQLTTGLQSDVLRTRTVPLALLFDRYVRVARDVARINEREIEMEVVGREVEIDRDVIEALGEPLSRLVRFAARCVEPAAERRAAGKSAAAAMRLAAESREGQVAIRIECDGALPERDEVAPIAATLGLVDPDDLEHMDDDEVLMLLARDDFPGSDLAGVTDLLDRIRGRLRIREEADGFSCELVVAVRSTSVRAILCRVGDHAYAVPVRSVVEILQPDSDTLVEASRSRMLRRRDTLIPLIRMSELLEEPGAGATWTAVIVRGADRAFGLVVDEVLGQEEIVIKELADGRAFGPVSGATIRDDGGVSLILDVDAIEEAARDELEGRRLAA